MNKLVIWDFEWTLFNPEAGLLAPGAKDLLTEGEANGYVNILYSENAENDTRVSDLAAALKINHLLAEIIVRRQKNLRDLYGILTHYSQIDAEKMYLVSHRARKDIKFGNLFGLKTFWICHGPFAAETPRTFEEQPMVILRSLRELRGCLRQDFLI